MASQDHMASREPSPAGGVKPSREAELQSLLARAEAATGADLELDGLLEIAMTFAGHSGYEHRRGRFYVPGRFVTAVHEAPAYSASLDDALTLVERCKPDWAGLIGIEIAGSGMASIDHRDPCSHGVSAFGSTPPLALIAALLKALIAEAASPESGSTGVWPNQSPTPLSKTEDA